MKVTDAKKWVELWESVVTFIKKEYQAVLIFFIFTGWALTLYFMFGYLDKVLKQIDTNTKATQQSVVDSQPTNLDVKKGAELDASVNKVLETVLKSSGGDRAYLFQYSNTLRGVSGVHFRYINNTHEVVNNGTSREIQNNQQVPASVFVEGTSTLADGGFYCYDDVTKIPDKALSPILQSQKVRGICLYGIFNTEGKLVGFIGVDYVYNPLPTDLLPIHTALRVGKVRVQDLLFGIQ